MAPAPPLPSAALVLERTRHWLKAAVIGLELCPFAKAVYVKDQIRFRVSMAETPEALLEDLLEELRALSVADPERVDTAFLIHPYVLHDFFDYNDFLTVAELALAELELEGVLQIASFHPEYQYAGNAPSDLANYVTRSPYPMLHLLRESSVERALSTFPNPDSIVTKNRATLRQLGRTGWQRLLAESDDE